MKNREIVQNKLNSSINKISKLRLMLNRGASREEFTLALEELEDYLQQVHSFIETEPISNYEINNPFNK
jgi:hypothetical protein